MRGSNLLRCYTMSTDKQSPTFPRIIVPSSSGLRTPRNSLICLTLKMKSSCQTSAAVHQTILRNIPEDLNLRLYSNFRVLTFCALLIRRPD